MTWEYALDQAREGAPALLAEMLRDGYPPDEFRHALAELVERPPKAKRPTRTAKFTPSQADQIRRMFAALTSADPAMSATRARMLLAGRLHASVYSIRDVVERKKGYRD